MPNKSLNKYIESIKKYSRIDRTKEISLSKIIQTSHNTIDINEAIKQLTEANLLLALKHAFSFNWAIKNSRQFSILDLVSEANIGLYEAAKHYDAQKNPNINFCGYAIKIIDNAIINAIQKNGFIRVPTHHFKYYSEIKKILNEFGDEIKSSFILNRLKNHKKKISVKFIDMIRQEIKASIISLDSDPLIMNLANIDSSPSKNMEEIERKNGIESILKNLNEKEKDIIICHFYKNETFEAIARKYGVTRQYISILTKNVLRKLKNKIKGKREINENNKRTKCFTSFTNRRNYKIRQSAKFVQQLIKNSF